MTDRVRAIADAVLYEGYVLWPYRQTALKNQRRWTFGGVYPEGHSARHPDDRCTMRAECLVEGEPALDVRVRFLQVVTRQVLRDGAPVDEALVDGERHLTWQEAVEREIAGACGERVPIAIPPGRRREEHGAGVALVRSWDRLDGFVDVRAERLAAGLARVLVEVRNTSAWELDDREAALAHTFCSTHAVLRLRAGAFVSMTDPPDHLREAAAECRNEGCWPVLVEGRETLLCSPIILEDHPRIAPESPGDLFDGGEVDELLVLNILALTDEEKAEMRATDPRAREILERTEGLTNEQLLRLHGALR
jgi:hypothetical protein